MVSYDFVECLNNIFCQIELELQVFQQVLSDCCLLVGWVFELLVIGKDVEYDLMVIILVVQYIGKMVLVCVLCYYSYLFIQQ